MPIEKKERKEEEIVDVECIMVEVVDLSWGRDVHVGLDLNEEPIEGNDVNDQPTPIVKLPKAREYAHLLSNFIVEHSLEVSVVDVMQSS